MLFLPPVRTGHCHGCSVERSACIPDGSWQLGLDSLAEIYAFITTWDAVGHLAAHAVRCESHPDDFFLTSVVCGCLEHFRVSEIPAGAYN